MKKFEKSRTIEKYILVYKTKAEELIYNKRGYIKQQYKCNLIGTQLALERDWWGISKKERGPSLHFLQHQMPIYVFSF
jgi:hypothetical protein